MLCRMADVQLVKRVCSGHRIRKENVFPREYRYDERIMIFIQILICSKQGQGKKVPQVSLVPAKSTVQQRGVNVHCSYQ